MTDYPAMNSLFAVEIVAEMCLVCLQAMEYDFVAMCSNLMEEIAVNATDLYELAAFAVSVPFASVDRSKFAASIHCLWPLEPGKFQIIMSKNLMTFCSRY